MIKFWVLRIVWIMLTGYGLEQITLHASLFPVRRSLTWWRSKVKLNILAWISYLYLTQYFLFICGDGLHWFLSFLGEEAAAWLRLLRRLWSLHREGWTALSRLIRKMMPPWGSIPALLQHCTLELSPLGSQRPWTDPWWPLIQLKKYIVLGLIGICRVLGSSDLWCQENWRMKVF